MHDYARAEKYLDLRKLPSKTRLQDGSQLAEQLGQVLQRDARFDVDLLSRNPEGDPGEPNRERVDSFRDGDKTIDIDLERVTFRSGSAVWLFSQQTVDSIPQLARVASDSAIEKYLPEPLLKWKLLDTPVWIWVALILAGALAGVLSKLAARLVVSSLEGIFHAAAPRMNPQLLESFQDPLRLLLAVGGFMAGTQFMNLSPALHKLVARGGSLLLFWGAAWLLAKVVDLVMIRLRMVLAAKHQGFAYSALPLTSRALKIVIFLLTIAAVLSNWGYNTSTIIAGLGVGGVAVALAAQKTIENLFGGVAVITDRPVAVGDFCKFGDRVGTVEDIGLRSTRIRTLDRTIVAIPNGQFSSMMLENFSKRDKMWFHFTLNLRRDTTPDQVRTLLREIAQTLEKHSGVEIGPLPVRFIGVGTYSLDLEVFAYVSTKDFDDFLGTQQELLLQILDEVEAAGTALALPAQEYFPFGHTNGTTPREARPVEPVYSGPPQRS
jgi:MscS family membrane protein